MSKSLSSISLFSTVVGLILLSSSTIITEPFAAVEQVRVDRPRVYVNDVFTLSRGADYTYAFDSLVKNTSIIEIYVNSTQPYRFRIIDIITNRTVEEWESETVTNWEFPRWGVFFWTPPYNNVYHFIFDNPYVAPADLSVVIKEYYLKQIEDREVTLYRPVLDESYAYLGIGLITLAIILDLTVLGYEEIQNYKKKLEEKLQNYPTQMPLK